MDWIDFSFVNKNNNDNDDGDEDALRTFLMFSIVSTNTKPNLNESCKSRSLFKKHRSQSWNDSMLLLIKSNNELWFYSKVDDVDEDRDDGC